MNFDNLIRLVNTLNSSEPLQVGHPGFGKEEKDFLKNGENYCMVSGGHARVKHNFECDDVECKFMSLQMYMVMA